MNSEAKFLDFVQFMLPFDIMHDFFIFYDPLENVNKLEVEVWKLFPGQKQQNFAFFQKKNIHIGLRYVYKDAHFLNCGALAKLVHARKYNFIQQV